MRSGALAYDVAHLLGGAALVLSFALLAQRRVGGMIGVYAGQAAVLALAAAWQGWVQGAPELYAAALVILGANATAMPAALRRAARRRPPEGPGRIVSFFGSLTAGLGAAALAIVVVLSATLSSGVLAREALALALAVGLLGLLVMATRRDALQQVVGFLSLANGLVLAGIAGLPGTALSVAVLLLAAFGLAGLLVVRARDRAGVSPEAQT